MQNSLWLYFSALIRPIRVLTKTANCKNLDVDLENVKNVYFVSIWSPYCLRKHPQELIKLIAIFRDMLLLYFMRRNLLDIDSISISEKPTDTWSGVWDRFYSLGTGGSANRPTAIGLRLDFLYFVFLVTASKVGSTQWKSEGSDGRKQIVFFLYPCDYPCEKPEIFTQSNVLYFRRSSVL